MPFLKHILESCWAILAEISTHRKAAWGRQQSLMGDSSSNLPKSFCRLLQWVEWGNLTIGKANKGFFPASCMFVLWLLLKSWLAWLWIYCASFSRKTQNFPGIDWLKPKYLNVSIQFTSKLSIYFVTESSSIICPKTRFPRLLRGTKMTALIFTVAEHPSISAFHCGCLQLWRIIN